MEIFSIFKNNRTNSSNNLSAWKQISHLWHVNWGLFTLEKIPSLFYNTFSNFETFRKSRETLCLKESVTKVNINFFCQGGTWKTWKRRWFVIKDRCLYYFHHSSENDPKGIIPLENIQVRPVEDQGGKQFIFEIYPANPEFADFIKGCKTDSNGAVVQGNHKYYRYTNTANS